MPESAPSPEIVLDTIWAYQRSAALKTAIDLHLFTAIDEGANTAPAVAARCAAAERGIRILCDYLTTIGLLAKADGRYQLPLNTATFLSQRSPAYMGTIANFLMLPGLKGNFDDLTETVKRGSVSASGNTVAAENPIWVEFAKAMVPMIMPAAHAIADILDIAAAGPVRVLDVAAGHGMFGITLAQRNPEAEITAVDWAPVLGVAQEHARAAGVDARVHAQPGDAFTVPFGNGYDIVLVTNFLHHFDHETCIGFLKKVRAALDANGRVVILEMVPNPDRVSPPIPAGFSLTMLAGTPAGDAYTLDELNDQLRQAGFGQMTAHLLPTTQTVVVGQVAG
jgi:ubiquinone/menaquinone biosynthesis C-methylase UbiE